MKKGEDEKKVCSMAAKTGCRLMMGTMGDDDENSINGDITHNNNNCFSANERSQ